MKRKIFKYRKDETVNEDEFIAIESAIRDRTEARDEITGLHLKIEEDDITNQYAKGNFEVIIKTWNLRTKKSGDKNV